MFWCTQQWKLRIYLGTALFLDIIYLDFAKKKGGKREKKDMIQKQNEISQVSGTMLKGRDKRERSIKNYRKEKRYKSTLRLHHLSTSEGIL